MNTIEHAKNIAKLLNSIEESKERLDRFEKMSGKYVGLKIESNYSAHVHMDGSHLFDYIHSEEKKRLESLTESLKQALEWKQK